MTKGKLKYKITIEYKDPYQIRAIRQKVKNLRRNFRDLKEVEVAIEEVEE